MKVKFKVSLLVIISLIVLIAVFFITSSKLLAATTTVDLLTADAFAVLAGAGITNTGATTITGDVGSSPTRIENGFGPGANSVTFISGTNHNDPNPNDAATQQAKLDLTTAYLDAAGRTPATSTIAGGELGSRTLTAGVYKDDGAPASLAITGTSH